MEVSAFCAHVFERVPVPSSMDVQRCMKCRDYYELVKWTDGDRSFAKLRQAWPTWRVTPSEPREYHGR
jgi:hypothetical protein